MGCWLLVAGCGTRAHQTAPKSTKNEILKIFRLPGEADTLHPGNPERAAGQNPDVKERPRTPHGKFHPPPDRQRQRHRRRREADPKPCRRTICMLLHLYIYS